jgi:hypothetical protein
VLRAGGGCAQWARGRDPCRGVAGAGLCGRARWSGVRGRLPPPSFDRLRMSRGGAARTERAEGIGQVGGGVSPCPDGACGEGGPPPESRYCELCAWSASPVRGRRAGARCCNNEGVLLELNVGLRLGQVFARISRVPITVVTFEDHPERRSDALHELNPKQQHRIQPTLKSRRGHHSVCCFECLCHGRDYTAAFGPTGFDHNHPPNFRGKYLKLREMQFLHPTNWNNAFPPNSRHPIGVALV